MQPQPPQVAPASDPKGRWLELHSPTLRAVLIRRREVEEILGIKKTTLYKLLNEDPDFPQPVSLLATSRSRRWNHAQVLAYAASRD